MFAKLAQFGHLARTHSAGTTTRPCNDNHPLRLIATQRPRRPALTCRWHETPSGALECVWGQSTLGREAPWAKALGAKALGAKALGAVPAPMPPATETANSEEPWSLRAHGALREARSRDRTLREEKMSAINNAILRAVVLWVHVGIGPLFGRGPIAQACRTMQQRARNSAATGHRP